MTVLPILGESETELSVITVKGAKLKKVEVEGWPHELAQKPSGELLLSPSAAPPKTPKPGLTCVGFSFENPVPGGGGIDLEIEIPEPDYVFGNDDRLLIASKEATISPAPEYAMFRATRIPRSALRVRAMVPLHS